MLATTWASVASVRSLLAAGADPFALSADGLSALELACACGHADVAIELMRAGQRDGGRDTLRGCRYLLESVAVGGDAECAACVLQSHELADVEIVVTSAERLHGHDQAMAALLA